MKKAILIIAVVLVFFGLLVVLVGRSIGYLTGQTTIPSKSALVVSLDKVLTEQTPNLPFTRSLDFHHLVDAVQKAAKDSHIEGVLVYGNSLTMSMAQKEELKHALAAVIKAKKPVTVYFDAISIGSYYVVPKGAKVVMQGTEGGYVTMTGYYAPQMFMRELLEEKLGIKMNVVHIGKYKGAGEPFSRDSMSSYLREELASYLDDVWTNFTDSIPNSRGLNKKEFQENLYNGNYFALSPQDAQKDGFVDQFGYKLDQEDQYADTVGITRYAKRKNLQSTSGQIALIVAEGEIQMGTAQPSPFGGSSSIASDTTCRTIRRAADNSLIKAIVFRINSPGGSALASELIYQELQRAAKKKPVIASIGGMGASGGFYIACGCDKIFADNASIVGSIGVISIVPEFTHLMGKVGVHIDPVQKGKYSDFLSPYRKLKPEEARILTNEMLKIYTVFKSRVAKSRKMDMEKVEELAQGRIYSGRKGLKLGLVDRIGGLHEALEEAAKQAKLSSIRYRVFSSRKSFIEMILDRQTSVTTKWQDLLKLPPMGRPLLIAPSLVWKSEEGLK
ncbi:MAG: signal peptide peptidase SppA [Acidobacteria bacterium]|nr:signal peptide peptidase SppA [Acidobacteriota bacterium]